MTSSLVRPKRTRLFLVVGLFLCALLFAVLAFSSPVKSSSELCSRNISCTYVCTNPALIISAGATSYLSCSAKYVASNWDFDLNTVLPLYTYMTFLQVAEGVLVVAIFILMLGVRLPSSFDKTFRLPTLVKLSVVIVAVVLSFFYLLAVVTDMLQLDGSYLASGRISLAEYLVVNRYFEYLRPYFGPWLGLSAFILVFGATICVVLFRLDKGLYESLRNTLTFFTFPMVLILQVSLLILGRQEMAIHVTDFVAGSIGGVDLVSNWFVLVVVSGLFVVGLTCRRLLL